MTAEKLEDVSWFHAKLNEMQEADIPCEPRQGKVSFWTLVSPNVYIIARPNGGEDHFARKFLPTYADCKNFINADLIAQGVSPFSPESAAIRAGRLMLEEIERYGR